MILEIFVGVLTCIVVYCIWHRYRALTLRDRLGIPGPKANFLFGNLAQFAENHDNRVTLEKWRREYGDVFGIYVGPQLNVFVSNLDMAKDILVKQFNCFVDRANIPLIGSSGFKNALVALHGNTWKSVRSALSPTFSTGKLKQMQDIVHKKIDVFMAKLEENAKNRQSFDIMENFQRLTLDVIAKCAFAVDSNGQVDPQDQFAQNTNTFFRHFGFRTKLVVADIILPEFSNFWCKFRSWTRFGRAENVIVDGLRSVFLERKANFKSFKGIDIMQLLLQQSEELAENGKAATVGTGENKAEDEYGFMIAPNKKDAIKLSDEDIIANSLSFLLAGYETTATALSYVAWLLAKFPDVQRKLQAELDEKLANEAHLTYDMVRGLPYLDAVFKESLRYFPPIIGLTSRKCVEECVVNGVRFVPGVVAIITTYMIQHDPENWPDPELFLPERFLEKGDRHPMAWIPFGGGPRNCIGMRFADMEFKICLARLLLKFNIEKGANFEDPLQLESLSPLQRPVNGIRIALSMRV